MCLVVKTYERAIRQIDADSVQDFIVRVSDCIALRTHQFEKRHVFIDEMRRVGVAK